MGIMEEWNIGMMGPKNRVLKPIIPLFQYSNLLPLRSPLPLCSPSCFHARSIEGKKGLDSQKEKRTPNRRDTGGRREDDWKIGMMEYWETHCITHHSISFFCLNSAVSAYSAVKFFLTHSAFETPCPNILFLLA
jgi:hypothetical protein